MVRGRFRRAMATGAVTFALAPISLVLGVGAVSAEASSESVIVRAVPGQLGAAESEVVGDGGTIVRELGIIDGFAAQVPARSLDDLRAQPSVREVTADAKVTFQGTTSGYSAGNDISSLFNVIRSMGVNQLWNQHFSGQGVGVALIDSGVTPVMGLASGNVVNGPDLSLDAGQANL